MKLKKIDGNFAVVEAGGLKKRVNIQMLASVKLGDYVIVHAGFAIQKMDAEAARQTLMIIDEIH